jgi:hypothetical protein
MVKVAGCWELGWTTPIMEYDLWAFPLRDFKVDEYIMCPISGINREVTEFKTIEDIISANPDLTPVFLDENGEHKLEDFKHPENALYILGKASYSPFSARAKEGLSVRIEDSEGLLWPHQAISIVLYNRRGKWQ